MACEKPSLHFPIVNQLALPKGCMKHKLALVTGGGTGLGKAIATTFAALGARVAIAARRVEVLQEAAADIRQKTGGQVEVFQMDVKKPEQITQTIDDIEKKFGQLPNILVNNAAGNFIMATERLSPNAVKAVIDIVVLGTMNLTLELGKRAIQKGHGCTVLSISTPYARNGGPFTVPSAISKAGVENMTRSLATEWAKHGWRFNVIAPGPIPTEGAFGRLMPGKLEDAAAMAGQTVPAGRCGTPEELANLASFIIDFDGGQQWFNHGSSIGARELHQMTNDAWGQIEDTIRGRTGKAKSKI